MRLKANTLAQFIQQVRRIQDPNWDGVAHKSDSGETISQPHTNAFAHFPTKTVVFFQGDQLNATPEELALLKEAGVDIKDLKNAFASNLMNYFSLNTRLNQTLTSNNLILTNSSNVLQIY